VKPIFGMFDSGVGGLSVLRSVHELLPRQDILYFSDQLHVPYGSRQLLEVRQFSHEITRFLLEQGAAIIVVACNAASAAALHSLREEFPGIPFVGMEPAVKPAAEQTHTGAVGVLATPATFQGDLYASVVERFANGVNLLQATCPGLVSQIEKGDLDGPETRHILETALRPMLARNIDTIVLGCTHYPFVIPLIQQIAGPAVRVIDPAPAIARQAMKMLQTIAGPSVPQSKADIRCLTSSDPHGLRNFLKRALHEHFPVRQARWEGNRLRGI
jgi:glutamate racemase